MRVTVNQSADETPSAGLTSFREGLINRGLCPRERHGWQRRG